MIPLVLIAYNRPGKLKHVLDAIKRQTVKPERMIAYVDGVRPQEEGVNIRAVKNMLAHHGFEVLERRQNVGCATNLMTGLHDVCNTYGSFLVLEDDVVPANCWYECATLLMNKYRNEPLIGSVGSFPSILNDSLPDYHYDVIFSPRFSSSGWGMWADKFFEIYPEWEVYRRGDMPWRVEELPSHAGHDMEWMLRGSNRRHAWDVGVACGFLERGWLQVIPKYYLVNNIGAESYMRTEHMAFMLENNVIEERVPTIFPPVVKLYPEVSRAVCDYVRIMAAPEGLRAFP